GGAGPGAGVPARPGRHAGRRSAMGRFHVDRAVAAARLAAPPGLRRTAMARAAGSGVMTDMSITLGQLYPDLMCTYGDRGKVDTIRRRCGWRGIAADVIQLHLADRIRPGELDLIVIGSGGEAQQALIASDLAGIKGPGIREAVEQGVAALAVGTGYEL